ncbi:MAG: hypothetical protein E7058_04210 [Lentisphaerae bacterium]|nr:hypothetical protein [Lentisphaerota bacterium]
MRKMVKMLCLCMLNCAVALSVSAGDWQRTAMTYAPDRGYENAAAHYVEKWGWKDAAGEIIQYYPKYFTPGGMLEMTFIYRGKERKLPPLELSVDGVRQQEVMDQPGRNVVWYRITPLSPLPGAVVRVMARFRAHPDKPVALQLNSGTQKVWEEVVDLRKLPRSRLLRMTMDDSMKQLNIFVRHSAGAKLGKVLFDGMDLSANVSAGSVYGNILPLKLTLPMPLAKGSHHTLIFEYGSVVSSYGFQAHRNNFGCAIYGGPHPENMKWHNFDIYFDHGSTQISRIMANYRNGIESVFMIKGAYHQYRELPGILGDYLTDEPDVGDFMHYKSINPPYLRLGMNAPKLNKKVQDKNQQAQSLLNISTINGTFKPGEYYNYARITDVVAMDPYSVSAGRSVMEVYDLGKVVHAANEPGIFWTLIGCYAYKKAHWKRFPNDDEMLFMVRSAVAAGTQSIGYWMYVNGSLTYGPVANPGLWRTMGRINGELKNAAHLLRKSCPAEVPVKVPDGVAAHLLRTIDDEATLIMLINTGCVSDASGITIPPVKKFRLETVLPPGCPAVEVFRMTPDGPEKCKFTTTSDGKTAFEIDMTHSAFFVIPHHRNAADKIIDIWKKKILPNNLMAEKIFRGRTVAAESDLKDYPALVDSRLIAPAKECGGREETLNGAWVDHFQGQSYRRAGEEKMEISWQLPPEAGDIYLQYSSEEQPVISLVKSDGVREDMILPPARRTGIKIAHDGKAQRMTLALTSGVSGRSLFFVPRALADKKMKFHRSADVKILGDEPVSPEKAAALTDGNLVKGPRWSNSKNRLKKHQPVIRLDFPEAVKLKNVIVCGWNNRTYGINRLYGKVTFADGSSVTLPDRKSFTGGNGIWYRKYIFWWDLPDKAVKNVEIIPSPANFLWIDIGEIICVER